MKLKKHEGILLGITLLFIALSIFTSFNRTEHINIAEHAEVQTLPYLININTAAVDELDLLDGIGPSTANKIVEYREKNGTFKSKEDLCNVSGIGGATLDKIKDYITV